LIVIPLLALGIVVSLVYAAYRGARKWGVGVWCFIAAGVNFLGASGVLGEHLWGPQWSWNFAHRGAGYAEGALAQGILWLAAGVCLRVQKPARVTLVR
jgi:hypothetical protein